MCVMYREGIMDPKVTDIAERIRALRESEDIGVEEMADATDVGVDEYRDIESGNSDFSFTFLYRCAKRFGVDIVELLTGEAPHLTEYTVVRKGKGLPMKRRDGFDYFHLSSHFKNKSVEPFLVKAPFVADAQDRPMTLSVHEGQEFDYILKGSLKFTFGKHTEVLNEGDSVFYDSGKRHGMIATDPEGCTFIAVIIRKDAVKR